MGELQKKTLGRVNSVGPLHPGGVGDLGTDYMYAWICLDSREERAGKGYLRKSSSWELRLKVDYLLVGKRWEIVGKKSTNSCLLQHTCFKVLFRGFCLWKLELRMSKK